MFRKRAAGNGTSSPTQKEGQVREGSSFWTCPACRTAVHIGLMAFHISSCPVIAADEVAPKRKTRHGTDEEQERDKQGNGQSVPLGSPEFSIVKKWSIPQNVSVGEEDEEDKFSMMPRGRPEPRNPSVCKDNSDETEDVLPEEQPPKGRVASFSSHLSMDGDSKGEQLLSCPHPETPIQEGRDRIGVDVQRPVSPSSPPAEVRKRLFEDDWGWQLSPERPELVVQHASSFLSEGAGASGSPFLLNLQVKRPRVREFDRDESRMVVDLGLIDSGSTGGDVAEVKTLPYLDSIQDSQQERQDEVVAPDRIETSPQELEKKLETDQKLESRNIFSLEAVAEIGDGKRIGDGISERKLQLENVIRELREKCSGALLRETKLRQILDLKNEECERLHRREQELQSELLSVRGQLENTLQQLRNIVERGDQKSANEIQSATQVYKEDESVATQLLSQTSNTPASCTDRPRATKAEFVITRVSSVSSQNLMKAHNLVEIANEEQATQLLSDGLDPGCSPDTDEAGENSHASADFRRVSDSCTGPSDVKPEDPFLSLEAALGKVDEFLAQRLFDGGTKVNNAILNDEFSSPLPCAMNAAAVLAPHTPGKALLRPADEHEERDTLGGHNRCTVGKQRTDVIPGGGPKTPENFAVMLGRQEKGLISEMLDSFPPAQGIETHVGIDPFDDHFLETVNKTTSNVPSASKDDPIPMPEDGQTFPTDGVHYKIRLENERLNERKPPTSPQASENSKQEVARKKKRRNPALVIDSDSDEDIGDMDIARDVGDSRKGTKDSTLSGTKVDKLDSGQGRQISNPGDDSHPGPVIEASSKDRSPDQRPSSSPQIKILFGTEGEENAPGISVASSRKEADKVCFNIPDPLVEILRKDRLLFSRPSVNVLLSSDEEEDICEGSGGSGKKGKRRRLVKVQESADGTKIPRQDLDSERTRDSGTEVLRRRSERLRNVYVSDPKESTLLSKQDGESDSEQERNEGLGTSGHGSSSKPHVLDDDDDIVEIDSDSSDDRLTGALHKRRKDIATQIHRYSGAQRALFVSKQDIEHDDDDDIETDDSGFINDDEESDADACSFSAADEISDSGEGSENDGSSASRSSLDGREKYTWDLEGDMLAALGKDTELCLRGLCAIYRRQEEDEKDSASSKYLNKRGFSKFHSARASMLASFLMGDTNTGPVVKAVKELRRAFGDNAVTYCADMCNHYSKQLFDIYLNKEDPYFPEPYTGPMM